MSTKKMGRPAIFKDRVTVSFDMDRDMYDELKAEVDISGLSQSAILRLSVSDYLTKQTLAEFEHEMDE